MTNQSVDICEFEIDSKTYYIHRQSECITNLDLFSQLSHCPIYPKIYWEHRDDKEQKIAYGKLLESFSVPQIHLKQIIKGKGFELCFFGGKSFSKSKNSHKLKVFKDFPDQYFFLPQYEIIQTKQASYLYNYQISYTMHEQACFISPKLFEDSLSEENSLITTLCQHYPAKPEWINQVNTLIQKMKTSSLEKVVLARCSEYHLNLQANPFGFMKNLKSKLKNSSFFCLALDANSLFLGATPECLYKRHHQELFTEAVAGTCKAEAKIDLLKSVKELKEFHYVTDFFADKLNLFSKKIVKSDDQILHVGHIKHLYSQFKAHVASPTKDEELLKALFPSPALCGYPSEQALNEIENIESFERGWYASPIGYISQNGAVFNIAIRSCLITNKKVFIFVGNGITKDSSPDEEWGELNAKISPLIEGEKYAVC